MHTGPGDNSGSTLDESRPASAPTGTETAGPFAVPGFDAVARLVARTLEVPLVALVLRDGSAYWYAAGADDPAPLANTSAPAYLDAALNSSGNVILDARGDARFNPLPPLAGTDIGTVGFFASEPVCTLAGQRVGALCVLDRTPRAMLDERARAALRDAAALAGTGMVLSSYLGRTDPVTRLPDRNALLQDLHTRLRGASDTLWLAAVEVAPTERFHAFVRAMGHAYADELMRVVAARVQAWASPDMRLYQVDTARLAILLPQAHGQPAPRRLDELVAQLRFPVDCLGIPLSLQPGVGLLQVSAGDLRGGDSLRRVMSASHVAQRSALGWAVYDQAQDEDHRQDFFLVTELAAALTERAELDLHYQPRVDLDSGRCVALEALVRWQHPVLGAVLPGRFVPLAERAGLMRALTEWVFDHALEQLATWLAQDIDIRLSLNISSADFDASLVERLQATLARHDLATYRLELEFTESTLMQQCDTARRYLATLRTLGVAIAIDDFGTGYSNLAALRQMPATSLKIDQSLVRAIDGSASDAAVVRSVAALAHELGFRVVAEGVENAAIYAIVRGMACDEAQGFEIARPLRAADVPSWLHAYANAPLPPRHLAA